MGTHLAIDKVNALLEAAKNKAKQKGPAKAYKPSKKQVWAVMKNGKPRSVIIDAGLKGLQAFNDLFTKALKDGNAFKALNDGDCPCHGAVLGVAEAAGALEEELEAYRQMTDADAYEAVKEYLPNGIQAYAAEELILVHGFPYDKVKDLDEDTGKAALRLAQEQAEEEEAATRKADSAKKDSAKPPAKRQRTAAAK